MIKKTAIILLTILVSFISLQGCEDDTIPSEPSNTVPEEPNNETPNNGARDVGLCPTLSWSCSDVDGDSLIYDIYFGQNSNPDLIIENHDKLIYYTDSLKKSTVYYWKISAKDPSGDVSTGNVWSFTTSSFVCGNTLNYSGKTYSTIKIGDQCWFKENLDVGTMIQSTTEGTNNGVIEKYCDENNPTHCEIYGGLYQWDEAMQYSSTVGSRGICPLGWHIPTKADYQTLSDVVGGSGNALKDIGQGYEDYGGAGTNTSGFSALLAGAGPFDDGFFGHRRYYAHLWSSNYEANITLSAWSDKISFESFNDKIGLSIRCLKD